MTFIDTSILVHAAATPSPDHRRAKSAFSRALAAGRLTLSRQVVREYLSVITRPQPWGNTLSLADAIVSANVFLRRFHILEDGELVWAELARLGQSHDFAGKQVHDANIVATMLAHAETRVLTFNDKHFRRFEPLIQVLTP